MPDIRAGRRIKKFYRTVTVETIGDGAGVLLDERRAKTPAGARLVAPKIALAEAIADEWRGDDEFVDFDAMHLTRMASTVIDLAAKEQAQWRAEILKFMKSDLLCYRAEASEELALRQARLWDPYLDWAREAMSVDLGVTTGVVAIEQPAAAIESVAAHIEEFDSWILLGVRRATELAGSAILGLALHSDAFSAGEIFDASRLDENFQAEKWGEDDEAQARERLIRSAFMACDQWLRSLKA